MKPVAIFRHLSIEGPGYFATFLERHSVPWRLIAVDAGEPVPESPNLFSGLCFMGGPMSVNDTLPWIRSSLALIRAAVDADIPVIGHCLGGQLMAKALGGVVRPQPIKEIGWGEVRASGTESTATAWLGEHRRFIAFHWHGETFSLPPGADRLLSSAHCENQAFVRGKHLALQCHVEMTETMIGQWCASGVEEIARRRPQDAIQAAEDMMAQAPERLPAMQQAADRLYTRWLEGLLR